MIPGGPPLSCSVTRINLNVCYASHAPQNNANAVYFSSYSRWVRLAVGIVVRMVCVFLKIAWSGENIFT